MTLLAVVVEFISTMGEVLLEEILPASCNWLSYVSYDRYFLLFGLMLHLKISVSSITLGSRHMAVDICTYVVQEIMHIILSTLRYSMVFLVSHELRAEVVEALKMQDLTLQDLLTHPALLARRQSDAQICSIRL